MAASRKEVPRYETRELAALSVSSAKHEASDVPSNATPSVWRTVRSVLGIAEGRAVWADGHAYRRDAFAVYLRPIARRSLGAAGPRTCAPLLSRSCCGVNRLFGFAFAIAFALASSSPVRASSATPDMM